MKIVFILALIGLAFIDGFIVGRETTPPMQLNMGGSLIFPDNACKMTAGGYWYAETVDKKTLVTSAEAAPCSEFYKQFGIDKPLDDSSILPTDND